jgi:hypothetical protein
MNNEEKLHQILDDMPKNFTTDRFNEACRIHGLDEILEKKATRGFLSIHCTEITRRRWVKKGHWKRDDKEEVKQLELEVAMPVNEAKNKEVIESLMSRVKELELRLQPEPLKPEAYQRWKPDNDLYYNCVNGHGDLDGSHFDQGSHYDSFQYKIGNCFKTEEEAKLHRDKQLLTQELKDFAEGGEWIDGGGNWRIYCDTELDKFCTCHAEITRELNQIYFKSSERAIEAIRHFGDRLNILFN